MTDDDWAYSPANPDRLPARLVLLESVMLAEAMTALEAAYGRLVAADAAVRTSRASWLPYSAVRAYDGAAAEYLAALERLELLQGSA